MQDSDATASDAVAKSVDERDEDHSQVRKLRVADLMRGGREVVILHGGFEYLLRITSNDRLILTKRS